MTAFPRPGGFRVVPERNLREEDPTANRVALSGSEDRAPALGCPLLQGRLIDSQTDPITGTVSQHVLIPAGGVTAVFHGLQRQLVGWIVVRNGNAAGTGNTLPTEQSADASTLVLGNPSAVDLRVHLWVF